MERNELSYEAGLDFRTERFTFFYHTFPSSSVYMVNGTEHVPWFASPQHSNMVIVLPLNGIIII
jgi:hypothetical protein